MFWADAYGLCALAVWFGLAALAAICNRAEANRLSTWQIFFLTGLMASIWPLIAVFAWVDNGQWIEVDNDGVDRED